MELNIQELDIAIIKRYKHSGIWMGD